MGYKNFSLDSASKQANTCSYEVKTMKPPIVNRTIQTLLLGSAPFMGSAKAQTVPPSKDIVIEQPASLPELARRPGIAFHFYTESGDVRAYLRAGQTLPSYTPQHS